MFCQVYCPAEHIPSPRDFDIIAPGCWAVPYGHRIIVMWLPERHIVSQTEHERRAKTQTRRTRDPGTQNLHNKISTLKFHCVNLLAKSLNRFIQKLLVQSSSQCLI